MKSCLHCGHTFTPTRSNQKYCCSKDCKREWQRKKMQTDSDYRENQRVAQQRWCEKNKDYWKNYRASHSDYTIRNRLQQQDRNAQRYPHTKQEGDDNIAKMDAKLAEISGTYYILPLTSCTEFPELIAKMDAKLVNHSLEKRLLFSIQDNGIHTAVQAIKSDEDRSRVVLLDGFKRYRAARKLGISSLPVEIVAHDNVSGFLILLRIGNQSTLSTLEQASFLRDLHIGYHLSFSEISRRLERSLTWVSVRINLITTMKDDIRHKILQGKFPLRSYMYTLAPFTRVKGKVDDVKKFINATSGKGYSTRDIEVLSHAYFSDDTKVKEQILCGNTDWTLQMLKKEPCAGNDASESDTIYHALKSCRWHTAQILKHYRSSPELFLEKRNAGVFDFVMSNCKEISELKGKVK